MKRTEDLTGKVFGELTVIEFTRSYSKNRHWKCLCSCGKEVELSTRQIKHDRKSCGHLGYQHRYTDLIGQVFGDLTVIDQNPTKRRLRQWVCKCRCGNQRIATTAELRANRTTTCGAHLLRSGSKYKEIWGSLWNNIRRNAIERGYEFDLTIEYAWELFLLQDRKCAISGMPICFSPKCGNQKLTSASLDRIDNAYGYTAGNVQWLHKDINRAKWTHNQEYFINLCKLIATYNP